MADFKIQIPRVSVAVSEATLIEVLVPEGGHVQEGDPLFLIETEKVENEVEAGASGIVHWTGEPGAVYEIGAAIGEIRSS